MSRRGNCWDNAVAESFFATLEWELLDDTHFATHAACHGALVSFIDTWYNHERLHSSLAYQTPVQFEQDLLRTRRRRTEWKLMAGFHSVLLHFNVA